MGLVKVEILQGHLQPDRPNDMEPYLSVAEWIKLVDAIDTNLRFFRRLHMFMRAIVLSGFILGLVSLLILAFSGVVWFAVIFIVCIIGVVSYSFSVTHCSQRMGDSAAKKTFQEHESFYKGKGINGFQFIRERDGSTNRYKPFSFFLGMSIVENESVTP